MKADSNDDTARLPGPPGFGTGASLTREPRYLAAHDVEDPSSGDGHREELWRAYLFRNGFAVGEQAGDVHFDRFSSSVPALLDTAGMGEASRKSRDCHIEVAVLVGLNHDRLGAHGPHLLTGRIGTRRY